MPRSTLGHSLSIPVLHADNRRRWPSDPRGWFTMCQQELNCTPTPLLPARRGINTAQRWRLPGSLTHQTGQITTYCSYQETSLKTSLHYFTFKSGKWGYYFTYSQQTCHIHIHQGYFCCCGFSVRDRFSGFYAENVAKINIYVQNLQADLKIHSTVFHGLQARRRHSSSQKRIMHWHDSNHSTKHYIHGQSCAHYYWSL